MRLGIVGNGVVGSATAEIFRKEHEVLAWDSLPDRRTVGNLGDVLACDLVFLCLPTPMAEDGSCDTSVIDRFLESLDPGPPCSLVLRSTVPVSYTGRLFARKLRRLCTFSHWPEFLTARTALRDAAEPVRNVVGMTRWNPVLVSLLTERFPDVPLFLMTTDESEAVKLVQNSFSAVKIAFFNETRCLADKAGLDWTAVLRAVLAGGWVNPMHTQVPGPDGLRGFGGSCLPKDLSSLIHQIEHFGLPASVCRGALDRNRLDRGAAP